MIVSIHQPQYLPWLPYLLKIERSDAFVILDSVDFQKNGLQNRNQVKTAQGPQWLTVPVRQKLGQKIIDVQIEAHSDWRKKHWQTLLQNYRKAPAFADYAPELEALYQREWESLCELNVVLLGMLMRWMRIERPVHHSSTLDCQGAASELVLNLCRKLGATRYLSGTGGRDYLDEGAFAAAGIEIEYAPLALPGAYPQLYPAAGFSADLAAIDILLNCGARYRDYLPAGSAAA
jgi:hypothetical protein